MMNSAEENIMETEPTPQVPSDPGLIPFGWLRAMVYFIFFLFGTVILQLIAYISLGVSLGSVTEELMVTSDGVIVQAVTMLGIVLLTFIFRRLIDRKSFKSLGFSFAGTFQKDFLHGLLWGIGLIGSVFLILMVIGQIEIISVGLPDSSIWLMILLFVFVAVTEELSMRGYILPNLMNSINKYSALLLTAVLFSAMHMMNPNASMIGLLNIVLAGLLLGIYYLHKKNLWFPIGMHFTWNLFQGTVFGSAVSGVKIPSMISFENIGDDLITGGAFGFEASIITSIMIIISIILIHMKYKQADSNDSERSLGNSLSAE